MRLIDADALKHELDVRGIIEVYGTQVNLAIDGMRTIEERKTGRWIHDGRDNPHGIDWCHCSVCGNRDSVDSVYTHADVYPYCARCGAYMGDEVKK